MVSSRRGSNVVTLENLGVESSLILSLRNPSPVQEPRNRQSPIDIETSNCIFDSKLVERPLQIIYPRRLCDGCAFHNTGHSWKLSIGQCERYFIRGGPLGDRYCLEQVHAHWGADESCGSEHLVDGQPYAGELHFVHWNSDKYDSFQMATEHEDGLAVIGVFLKIGTAHGELGKLTYLLDHVHNPNDHCEMRTELDLYNLLPSDISHYWTYDGSLTTAPYSECITWIVLETPVSVSHEQLEAMRALMGHHSDSSPDCDGRMLQNYRAVQHRDQCRVRSSFMPDLPPRQQSPINIYTGNAFFLKQLSESPLMIDYPDGATGVTFENTGHTWKITPMEKQFEIEGGPLKDIYHLDHVHAHWGSTSRAGSEHLVDGRPFSGELHFVHWNTKYGNLAKAITKPDGLAVIGVFLQIGKPNVHLSKLTESVDEICYAGSRAELADFDIKHLLPTDSDQYWSYQGSLTTPPYFECVTWIVMKEAVDVGPDQLIGMRTLCCYSKDDVNVQGHENGNNGHLMHNYRPVQRLRTCEVWSSFD